MPLGAIGLGWYARSRTTPAMGWHGERGRARAGMLLGAVGAAMFAGFAVIRLARSWDDQRVNARNVEIGDCVRIDPDPDPDDDAVAFLRLVDCEDTHDGEVFHAGRVDQDLESSHEERRREGAATANDSCAAAFDDYVGERYSRSRYEMVTFLPLDKAWDNPSAYFKCLVVRPDGGELEGSARRSGD